MGGALGAFESHWIPMGDAGLWATLSMAAMMGGTMRSPLTAMIFTLELTHDLNLLPALLVSCIAAHAVTVLALRRSILTEKVARRGFHINREYIVDPLMGMRVSEAMDEDPPTIPAEMKLSVLSDVLAKNDRRLSRRQGTLIVNEEGLLAGIITRGDVLKGIEEFSHQNLTVLEAGSRNLIVTYPDEILYEAIDKMVRNDIGRLPVVSRENSRAIVGYLGRAAVMTARQHRLREEHERERGWLQGLA
jgi:CBS domain-containing protein